MTLPKQQHAKDKNSVPEQNEQVGQKEGAEENKLKGLEKARKALQEKREREKREAEARRTREVGGKQETGEKLEKDKTKVDQAAKVKVQKTKQMKNVNQKGGREQRVRKLEEARLLRESQLQVNQDGRTHGQSRLFGPSNEVWGAGVLNEAIINLDVK